MGLIEEIRKNRKLSAILCLTIIITLSRVFLKDITQLDLYFLPLYWGMGLVFFWYGFDNIINTTSYTNVANEVLKKFHLEKQTHKINFSKLSRVQGMLEILCAISFISGVYTHVFALLSSIIVLGVIFAYEESFGSLLIRDVGILGSTLTIFLLTSAK